MQCPPLCWMLCIYSHQYPLNSNIKTAQVSPSLALRQLSTPHCTSTIGYASNQCLDQSPLADTVFRQYVYFSLDPSPSAPQVCFFFSLPFIHGVIFLSPTVTSSPEAFFSWEPERACIAFSNEEEEFAFFISKVFFSLAVQHPACQHSHYFIFSLIVHPALWVLLWIWVFCFYHFIHFFQNILYHNTFCSQRARQPGI